MLRRLVLGCGSIGHPVVEDLAGHKGDLVVIERDEGRVETLRGEGIAAEHADPSDPETLAAYPADIVFVGGDDPANNLAALRAADESHPAATLVAYTGTEPGSVKRRRMAEIADRLVAYDETIATAVLGATKGEAGERLRAMRRVLASVDGTLGVFTHDDPDPDAIGSAIALVALAESKGIDAEACYFGEIAHQENRALVNLLDIELTGLDPETFDPERFDAIALVDHSRPGVNDRLPPETDVDMVIDHHPPRGPIEADFVDLRSDVGATCTLLVDYLRGFGLDLDTTTATALLYGIRVDTRDFGREITQADFEAAAHLLPHAEIDVLERVESPSVSGDTFDTIARAIENARREGPILVSGVGPINNRDAIAQAADQLLMMEGVTTTVVHGFMDETVYVSGRTRGSDIDIGETMRHAFERIGSAGGHADMAGAQLPLGIIGTVEEDESLAEVVSDVVGERFLEALGTVSTFESPLVRSASTGTSDTTDHDPG